MAKFTVVDVRKVPSPDTARVGELDNLVTYKLDEFRIYMVRIPKTDITDEDVKAAVSKDLESIQRLIGREFET